MTPAQQLAGLQLDNGWTVVKAVDKKPNSTGGFFSHGYIAVHSDGRQGFLKALDYTKAFQTPSPSQVLLGMMNAYVFEKTLCQKVAHLSRISRAMADGVIDVDKTNPFHKVEYLIFELADGDVRSHLDAQAGLDVIFVLRTIHHVATGLAQLHGANIAHQDLKPSNVLVYPAATGSKICDLGRAWDLNMSSPHDALHVPGDQAYATIEGMYRAVPTDHQARRFGCDMYHLGSLIVFLFARVHMTALIMNGLAPCHRPVGWGGTYADVLPFVQAAFDVAMQQFLAHVPTYLREDLGRIVGELCNPDPARRGHPKNKAAGQFSLERYITQFDLLANRAQLKLFAAKAGVVIQ